MLTRNQTKSIILNRLQEAETSNPITLTDVPAIAGLSEIDPPHERTIDTRLWKRRIRELQRGGWWIVSCAALLAMQSEGELDENICHDQTNSMNGFLLLSDQIDRVATYRWNVAKDIRKKSTSIKSKVLEHMLENAGRIVTCEELRYIAKEKTGWAHCLRELRTEDGWPIVTKNSGRPDLPVGTYLLEQDRQSPEHDRHIPDPVRREVLRRDNYRCQRCAWTHSLWNRSDPRHLELHHIDAHVSGGENVESNLITLCIVCHDLWHSEEQQWENRFNDWLSQ